MIYRYNVHAGSCLFPTHEDTLQCVYLNVDIHVSDIRDRSSFPVHSFGHCINLKLCHAYRFTFFIVLGIIFIFLTNKVNYRTSDFKVIVTL